MNNTLPIVFICDTGYVMQTTVAVTSLLHNGSGTARLALYIVTYGVDEQQEQALRGLGKAGTAVHVVRGDDAFPADRFRLSDSRYRVATKAALLKFFLPELLPELDRVLYLDGDIIVRGDLAPLADLELGEHLAAAVPDLPQVLYEKQLIGDSRQYFNSGVMLFNLAAMRREQTTERLVQAKLSFPDDNLMDQNVFNRVFAGRVLRLPLRYNVCCANLRRRWHREGMLQKINALYGTNYGSLREIVSGSLILHFSSREKPWKYYDVPAGREWTRYYEQAYQGHRLVRKSWRAFDLRNKLHKVFSGQDSR